MDDQRPALHLDRVSAGYPSARPVVEGVDLVVRPGEVVALVGPSGAGKTTLLRTAAGLLRPYAGTVTVLGRRWPERCPRGTIGYIPQRLGLVHHATTLENVAMGGLHREPAYRNLLRLPTARLVAEAEAALDAVGLLDKADAPVKELSGGQQRRTAIARALLQRPRLLLADEFLGELDRQTAATVQAAVLHLAETQGTAILLVEHHLTKAHTMADRVHEVDGGRMRDITDPARVDLEVHDDALLERRPDVEVA